MAFGTTMWGVNAAANGSAIGVTAIRITTSHIRWRGLCRLLTADRDRGAATTATAQATPAGPGSSAAPGMTTSMPRGSRLSRDYARAGLDEQSLAACQTTRSLTSFGHWSCSPKQIQGFSGWLVRVLLGGARLGLDDAQQSLSERRGLYQAVASPGKYIKQQPHAADPFRLGVSLHDHRRARTPRRRNTRSFTSRRRRTTSSSSCCS